MVHSPPGIRGKFKNAMKRNDMGEVKDIIEVLMGVGLSDKEIFQLLDITDDFYYQNISKHIDRPRQVVRYETLNDAIRYYKKLKEKYKELSKYIVECKKNFVEQRRKIVRLSDITKSLQILSEVMMYLSSRGWLSEEVAKLIYVSDTLSKIRVNVKKMESELPKKTSVDNIIIDDT